MASHKDTFVSATRQGARTDRTPLVFVSSEPPEHSPSKGWRETADDLHVVPGLGKYENEDHDSLDDLVERFKPFLLRSIVGGGST